MNKKHSLDFGKKEKVLNYACQTDQLSRPNKGGILKMLIQRQRDLKHYYQRAKRGYSFRDLWGIDSWFMEIMPEMLTALKNNKRGCPVQFTHNEDGTEKDFEKGMEEWQSVLERMIFCFREMNNDTCSMKNEYEEEYRRQCHKPNEGKSFKDWFKPCGKDETGEETYEWITGDADPELKENYFKKIREIEKYKNNMKNEGFELFSKYFWNLWD